MEVKITPAKKFQGINKQYLREIYAYRDMLFMLVRRDISSVYKQTVLGFAWAVFRPLVQMVVFTLFFGKLLGVGKQVGNDVPYALFSYAALVPWTYFAGSMNVATGSLVASKHFLTKVYFPRIVVPMAPIISKMVDFFIAFAILVVLLLIYGVYPSWQVILLPLPFVLLVLTSFGISIWLSAMAIQYRDIQQLMMFFAQLLMYAAPVIWPLSIIPEKFQLIYSAYPMVGVIEGFRASLLGNKPFPYEMIGIGYATSISMVIGGIIYFRNRERKFADVA